METIFWICVQLMVMGAKLLGISYQQLNVILFVILPPAITAFFWYQYRRYKRKYKLATADVNRSIV
ncbi:hypothetical protein [Pontibacter burrus]|uniref:Uncharacterized protein n=1 Tax=Pontibacter burrus TaxID=2704466 RepID=A0A6B3LI60_9BACT|nr:hypothetical protein [Pontibacter burrus]NEM96299.1 hypothetical protein [Pontibacter burrus]